MSGSIKQAALGLAFACGVALAAWPLGAGAATAPIGTLSRQEAQQVLSQVSRDYSKAEIDLLNDPNAFPNQLAYRDQYAKGLQAYSAGDYPAAVAHWNNTEVLIHQTPDLNQIE